MQPNNRFRTVCKSRRGLSQWTKAIHTPTSSFRSLCCGIGNTTKLSSRCNAASRWRRVRPKATWNSPVCTTIAAIPWLRSTRSTPTCDSIPCIRRWRCIFWRRRRHSLGQFETAVATLKLRLEREPNSETGYALLASCYGHLGQIDESRSAWAEVLRIAPDFSIERRWGVLPFRNPREYAHRVEGLRKAKLPV
jgi:tetratricopeptide (TPR) repeat protein